MEMIKGFDIVTAKPTPCKCTLFDAKPSSAEMEVNKLAIGTIIQCPLCEAKYEWKHAQRDGYYWQKVS